LTVLVDVGLTGSVSKYATEPVGAGTAPRYLSLLTSSAVYVAGSSRARRSSCVGWDSSSTPCGAPDAHMLRCSTESPVMPTGWPSFTRTGSPTACAYFSAGLTVRPVPVAPAVPTAVTVVNSSVWPVPTMSGWPARYPLVFADGLPPTV